MNIRYENGMPAGEDYFPLFESTGWNSEYRLTPQELMQAVASSQFVVTAYDSARLVGFGRVTSDGFMPAMIYEMIVHPDYQGRGIGAEVMKRLIEWCKEKRIHEIQLFCARGKRGLYEKSGFAARPEDGPGMQMMLGR